MGIKLFSSDSYPPVNPPPPLLVTTAQANPDPSKYEIISALKVGHYLIVEISYDNCTNYEGHKILVYKDVSLKSLLVSQKIKSIVPQ